MFLEITNPTVEDEKFSYQLSKHPDNIFYRSLDKLDNRTVTGKFISSNTYQIVSNTNSIAFLKEMRRANLEAYIHKDLTAVCPFNIKTILTALRSVLNGSFQDIPGDNFTKKELSEHEDYYSVKLGPIEIIDFDNFSNILNDYDLDIINHTTDHNIYVLEIKNKNKIHITKFLQKITFFCYYFTFEEDSLFKLDDGLNDKIISLSSLWIDDNLEHKKTIFSKLSALSQNFEKKIIDSIDITIDTTNQDNNIITYNIFDNVIQNSNDNTIVIIGNIKLKIPDSIKNTKEEYSQEKQKYNNERLDAFLQQFNNNNIILYTDKQYVIKYYNKLLRYVDLNIKVILTNYKLPDFSFIKNKKIDKLVILRKLKRNTNNLLSIFTNELNVKNIIWSEVASLPEMDVSAYNNSYELVDSNILNTISYKLKEKDTQLSNSILINKKEKRKKESKVVSLIDEYIEYNKDVILPINNYIVRKSDIENGIARIFNIDQILNDIFYLGPDIAPVDYSEEADNKAGNSEKYLENPYSAFEYYKNRGVTKVVEEPKHMGSRGYILAFRTYEIASKFNRTEKLYILSREGQQYLKENDFEIYKEKILNDIFNSIEDDFILLDCEMLPWAYKGSSLIEKSKSIASSILIHREYVNDPKLDNINKFINTLSNFSKDHDFEIHPFHVLAKGTYTDNRIEVNLHTASSTHYEQSLIINNIAKNSNIFFPLDLNVIELDSEQQKYRSFINWEKYCNNGGEGFVYKPYNHLSFYQNGTIIQSALKVRGHEYLRLVYGVDYLDDEIFNILINRNIKKKRGAAMLHTELSWYILNAFLSNKQIEKNKYILSFFGVKECTHVDKTL